MRRGDICADMVELAQDSGCQVWTYTALIQDSETPSWQLDYTPVNYRIPQGFISQAIGTTGYLNWTSNAWSNDPWTDPWIESFPNALADGVLVYPGEEAGVDGFVPSIRLKYARDGVYDYDYVELLKQAGYGDWAMDVVHQVADDFSDWSKDPAVLLAARIELGNKLNAINSSGLTHTITATAGAHGIISPEGDVTVNDGEDQEFIYTPDSGYKINQVRVDGEKVSVTDSYTFENVTEDHTIAVTFKEKSSSGSTSSAPDQNPVPATGGPKVDSGKIEAAPPQNVGGVAETTISGDTFAKGIGQCSGR